MTDNDNKKEIKSKKAMKALYSSIRESAHAVLGAASKSSTSFEYAYQKVQSEVSQSIIKSFNENLNFLEYVLDTNNFEFIREIPSNNYQKFNYAQLLPLIAECEKILGLLEEEPREITSQFKNKLSSLREQLEELQIPDLGIIKNMELSIEMFEKGNIFCSVLLASRVISYTINQFLIEKELVKENKNKKSKKSYIELISIDCINKGIIKKNEKQYQSNFLSYIKLARNLLTHELLFFPNNAESLGILSNSITLLDLYKRHNELLLKTKKEIK
ncbi:hypothetical protein LCGC14_0930590 [marine sediment metagenome]|uniref:Uncharacterized protein n=1 Tax=marine sediment metagenome TaxID=412755 RepID=A0A0F9R6K3_9ZZZZ